MSYDTPLQQQLGPSVTAAFGLKDWEKYGLNERLNFHFTCGTFANNNNNNNNNNNADTNNTATTTTTTNNNNNTNVSNYNKNDNNINTTLKEKTTTTTTTSDDESKNITTGTSGSSSSSFTKSNNNQTTLFILECVPTKPWHKLTRRQKKALAKSMHAFNNDNNTNRIPLKMNLQTRIFFTYETTRMVYILDASPTLTSTFGFSCCSSNTYSYNNNNNDGNNSNSSNMASAICPMDRFCIMSKQFFLALCANTIKSWQPHIAITVLAVFSRPTITSTTTKNRNNNNVDYTKQQQQKQYLSVLVRDYHIYDTTTALSLSNMIQEWCYNDIEIEIAERLSQLTSYDVGVIPQYTSSLYDMIEAGYAALSTLSNHARPCIVIATDCRSITNIPTYTDMFIETTGSNTDTSSSNKRMDDVPISIIDLSEHTGGNNNNNNNGNFDNNENNNNYYDNDDINNMHFLNFDPIGATFPLHLSDDSEAIYRFSRASGGVYFTGPLLDAAISTHAGEIHPLLESDVFFTFKRHRIHPNAVQWYILYTLSPLSPIVMHNTWGKLAPPPNIYDYYYNNNNNNIDSSNHNNSSNKTPVRTTFSNYIINPIPIHEILLMRIKEGYRAKQYGQQVMIAQNNNTYNNTEPQQQQQHQQNDSNRLSIQFILPLEHGTIIHYELNYRALPGYDARMVGFAHIKIELSGDAAFVWSVKNDFLHSQHYHQHGGSSSSSSSSNINNPNSIINSNQQRRAPRRLTMAQQVSARLCTYLRLIRKEDMLQSYLSPIKWSDQLTSSQTPFVRRLSTLTDQQWKRHFCIDEFDCVCTGCMPWEEDFILSEFRDTDNGDQQLIEAITEWATQTVTTGQCYVKQTDTDCGVSGYCVVNIKRSRVASRVFTISVETFGGISVDKRLGIIKSLKAVLTPLRSVEVLPKQIGPFLVGMKALQYAGPINFYYQRAMESQNMHTSWDLVKDPELIPLLMKRRKEIGHFFLLESSNDHALFARLYETTAACNNEQDPGNLVQYQLYILDDRVVVDLHMESESGSFFPFRNPKANQPMTTFHRLVASLKTRDQECAQALQCRTTLLQAFVADNIQDDNSLTFQSCVERLLGYASTMSFRLRFFNPDCGGANNILQSLTKDLLLSQSFGAKVAQLPIGAEANVSNLDPGQWFIVEYDKETISIVHMSLVDIQEISQDDGSSLIYRNLTFHTMGISDLYSRRDDVADDESDQDHISEYLQVSDFSESILSAHKQNYSAAIYLALKQDPENNSACIHLDDLAMVMEPLEFVEIARVLVSKEVNSKSNDYSKLCSLLGTVLHPIADEDYCMFYQKSNENEIFFPLDDDSDALEFSNDASIPATGDDDEGIQSQEDDIRTQDDDSLDFESADLEPTTRNVVSAPIFVRFLLDDHPISIHDLSKIDRSAHLSAVMSIFNTNQNSTAEHREANPSELQATHLTTALEISNLLHAYVAEQTLERLRCRGLDIDKQDIQLAKECLQKAPNIVASTIDVFFYVAKTDKIVAASAPAEATLEVEEGFTLLVSELTTNDAISLIPYSSGDRFLVTNRSAGDPVLPFWCFLKIRRTLGDISVGIHHPDGPRAASEVLETVLDTVSSCCNRVNKILLLRRLHNTRSASRLLIPPDNDIPPKKREEPQDSSPFDDGLFGCDVVFSTKFDLFHRCAANPRQVIRMLEATVLHIFAVSNRRKFFVYKDESGSIFYMSLKVVQRDTKADKGSQIELDVHGIDAPGPSITEQLNKLLQKRLLQIAVDMLSAVLTKNPHYSWKKADIDFIKSYESEWKALEDESTSDDTDRIRTYAFPSTACDPVMILLFLRQNLCGSTFFHSLSTAEWSDSDASAPVTTSGSTLHLDMTDLLFYFSTNPLKLDPSFQSESTLTAKGAKFSRQTGSGIAMIEVSLINQDGEPVSQLNAAEPTSHAESTLEFPLDQLRFHRSHQNNLKGLESVEARYYVRVQVTDTALNRSILHEWVQLSLNQVLIAWNVERQLERMQKGLLTARTPHCQANTGVDAKMEQIENLRCGLPALINLLDSSHELPHPAVLKAEFDGVVKSSSVASFALDLLEKAILDQLRSEVKKRFTIDHKKHLCVIRSCRSSFPQRVIMQRDSHGRVITKTFLSGSAEVGSLVKDSPIDCPEYTIFFFSPEYSGGEENNLPSLPKLFEEVSTGVASPGEKGESVRSRAQFKSQHLIHFRRSFCFIFSVKRNRRALLAYNWNAQLFKKIVSRIKERNNSFLNATGHSVAGLQRRSLGFLAPYSGSKQRSNRRTKQQRENRKDSLMNKIDLPNDSQKQSVDSGTTEKEPDINQGSLPKRRAKRPQMIRRPKLVGKSVEGSAMQAVARSRARASATSSSNRFRSSLQQGVIPNPRQQNDSTTLRNTSSRKVPTQGIVTRSLDQLTETDKDVIALKNDFRKTMSHSGMLSLHSLQRNTQQRVTKDRWPAKIGHQISLSLLEYLFSLGSLAWNESSALLPIPDRLSDSFLLSLGQTLAAWNPDLKPVFCNESSNLQNYFLMSKIRNVRNSKCFVAVRMSLNTIVENGQKRSVVVSEGRVLSLPRHRKESKSKGPRIMPHFLIEKDSSGFDKLAIDIHDTVRLQAKLLDHTSSIIERTMKSVVDVSEYSAVFLVLKCLIEDWYSLHPVLKLNSNYKCYEATIVLSSYNDWLINRYDGVSLFLWLRSNTPKTNLINCGSGGMCFKREVVVGVTHSICFLSSNSVDPGKMKISILCRTQGKKLREFMFREGSNVAVSVLENIAIEAAGLALHELRLAAASLHKEMLWSLASSASSMSAPKLNQIKEMLALCTRIPIYDLIETTADANHFASFMKNPVSIDLKHCCDALKQDSSFFPSWHYDGDNGNIHLYYMLSEDLFLMVKELGSIENDYGEIELILQEDNQSSKDRTTAATKKFINFVLHFLWSEMQLHNH